MLPNFDYGRQIMHTDVKKKGLPQMSANRPSIWFTRIDFSAQIVKSPEILSHLLLMVAIFPFPCAIRFPKSNRQTPTSPISSAFSGRYSAFSHFASFSCCVFPLCLPVVSLRCVSPGRQLQLLTVHTVLSSEAVGAGSSKRLPGETQRVPLHFPAQIVKSLEILSHLVLVVAIFPFPCAIRFPKSNRQTPTGPISSALLWSLFSFFSFYIIFLLCLPLCLSVVSPQGGVCNCWPSRPFWAVKLWGRAVPSASPVRHNWCHRFPKSNRQISTSPISSAFSGRYFALATPKCH